MEVRIDYVSLMITDCTLRVHIVWSCDALILSIHQNVKLNCALTFTINRIFLLLSLQQNEDILILSHVVVFRYQLVVVVVLLLLTINLTVAITLK